MGGWTLRMFDIYICTKAIKMHFGWIVDHDQSPMEEEKITWGGERQVHRPLFTGCPSGFGIQGKCQVSQSLFTYPPLKVPSLPISLYSSLPIGDGKKTHTKKNTLS
jgi:hypothetical protein